ncbi:MAG: hypothetical protein CM15mP102_14440 [Flavobacteriales bacterium]|nr:MAG: hypothetical protein CM15mP102_14440 [Flavobacteriales bacterium]
MDWIKALGLEPTRISIAGFLYGCVGFAICNFYDELYHD